MNYKIEELVEVVKFFWENVNEGVNIIGFSGNLGAGKTTFTKKLLETMDFAGNVISPTFVLRRDYEVAVRTFKNVIHIDAYRLEKPDQIYQVISKEELENKNNLILIEWPERVFENKVGENIFHKTFLFEHVDENTRKISVKA